MSKVTRREALKGLAASTAAAVGAPHREGAGAAGHPDPVVSLSPLGMPWRTPDPFLFCMHHHDDYPAGNDQLGPAASLAGRAMGQDFAGLDGWNMYHGDVVPGFPQHPHRGFETVTIVRQGLVDHADSLGAAARYGQGDVQWLTAGKGILHAEMFPLLSRDGRNPLDLFQVWLNLPRARKMVDPHFTMLWAPSVPRQRLRDEAGHEVEVTVIAGALGELRPPAPPPASWAAHADADVAIWTLKLAPGAAWTLPPAAAGSNRSLYFFRGSSVRVGARDVRVGQRIELRADVPAHVVAGDAEAELLMLQGRPINEPVVQHGPFVMNSVEEIREAFFDYQRTAFGGWPWPSHGPVHGDTGERFARHRDGRIERPT
jgi:redox-sensitive bicupin YhaK (pirin superfamily)